MSARRCPWCLDANSEQWSEHLCRTHMAEYSGTSVADLDRMESEQYAEWRDAMGY